MYKPVESTPLAHCSIPGPEEAGEDQVLTEYGRTNCESRRGICDAVAGFSEWEGLISGFFPEPGLPPDP